MLHLQLKKGLFSKSSVKKYFGGHHIGHQSPCPPSCWLPYRRFASEGSGTLTEWKSESITATMVTDMSLFQSGRLITFSYPDCLLLLERCSESGRLDVLEASESNAGETGGDNFFLQKLNLRAHRKASHAWIDKYRNDTLFGDRQLHDASEYGQYYYNIYWTSYSHHPSPNASPVDIYKNRWRCQESSDLFQEIW